MSSHKDIFQRYEWTWRWGSARPVPVIALLVWTCLVCRDKAPLLSSDEWLKGTALRESLINVTLSEAHSPTNLPSGRFRARARTLGGLADARLDPGASRGAPEGRRSSEARGRLPRRRLRPGSGTFRLRFPGGRSPCCFASLLVDVFAPLLAYVNHDLIGGLLYYCFYPLLPWWHVFAFLCGPTMLPNAYLLWVAIVQARRITRRCNRGGDAAGWRYRDPPLHLAVGAPRRARCMGRTHAHRPSGWFGRYGGRSGHR